MSSTRPSCRNCRVSMETGWIADRGHGNSLAKVTWVAGEPRHKHWLGLDWGVTIRGVKQHEVTSWRCPRCGLLESYADGPA